MLCIYFNWCTYVYIYINTGACRYIIQAYTAPKGQFTQCVYLLWLGSRYVIQVFHGWGYHLSHTVVIRVATGIPTVKLPVPQTVKPVMTSITRAVKHQFHSPGIQPVSHSVEQVSTGLTSW